MKKFSLVLFLTSSVLLANEPVQGATKADPGMTSMLMMGVMFVILWFFMIRPEQQKAKAKEEMRNSIQKGDKVITIGGICGTITKVYDDRFLIQINKENSVIVLKAAIDRKDMTEEEISKEKESNK